MLESDDRLMTKRYLVMTKSASRKKQVRGQRGADQLPLKLASLLFARKARHLSFLVEPFLHSHSDDPLKLGSVGSTVYLGMGNWEARWKKQSRQRWSGCSLFPRLRSPSHLGSPSPHICLIFQPTAPPSREAALTVNKKISTSPAHSSTARHLGSSESSRACTRVLTADCTRGYGTVLISSSSSSSASRDPFGLKQNFSWKPFPTICHL